MWKNKITKNVLFPPLGHFQFLRSSKGCNIFSSVHLCFVKIEKFYSTILCQWQYCSNGDRKMPHKLLVKSSLRFHTMKAAVYSGQQSRVVSVNKYKHSCSAEMASPWFNYLSCQSQWKNTPPDKARPHSLMSYRAFSHPEMHRHPSANSQIKPRDTRILLPKARR